MDFVKQKSFVDCSRVITDENKVNEKNESVDIKPVVVFTDCNGQNLNNSKMSDFQSFSNADVENDEKIHCITIDSESDDDHDDDDDDDDHIPLAKKLKLDNRLKIQKSNDAANLTTELENTKNKMVENVKASALKKRLSSLKLTVQSLANHVETNSKRKKSIVDKSKADIKKKKPDGVWCNTMTLKSFYNLLEKTPKVNLTRIDKSDTVRSSQSLSVSNELSPSNISVASVSTAQRQQQTKPRLVDASKISTSSLSRDNLVKHNLLKLETLWKNASNKDSKAVLAYRKFASNGVGLLKRHEIETIKDPSLRDDMLMRMDLHEERELLKNATGEEKKLYFQNKHKRMMEMKKQTHGVLNMKFEDTELPFSKPLPEPTEIKMPAGLSAYDFGDVLMIAEFLMSYSDLIMPKNKFPLNASQLLEALGDPSFNGRPLLAKIFVAFIETLLQTESYVELGVPLDDVEVNEHTISEMIRLVVSGISDDESDSGFDTNSIFTDSLDETYVEELKTVDCFLLPPRTILDILIHLQNKILRNSIFDDFLKDKEADFAEAWREQIEAQKDLKKYKNDNPETSSDCNTPKLDKIQESIKLETIESDQSGCDEVLPALTIEHFYGKQSKSIINKQQQQQQDHDNVEDKKLDSSHVTSDNTDSLLFKVKNRRALSQQERLRRIENENILKQKRQREYEIQIRENKVSTFAKKIQDLKEFQKYDVRCSLLGCDRNYSRYWFLPRCSAEFLYVEKVSLNGKTSKTFNDTGCLLTQTISWHFYNNVEQLESLKSSLLVKGVRESYLFDSLSKIFPELSANMKKKVDDPSTSTNNCLIKNVEDVETLLRLEESFKKYLRNEFLAVEHKVRQGGLGGIADLNLWLAQLNTSETIGDFARCLVEIRQYIRPSLLKGIMGGGGGGGGGGQQQQQRQKRKGMPNYKRSIEKINQSNLSTSTSIDDGSKDVEHNQNQHVAYAQNWSDAVNDCKTWSRLTILFSIFNNCIMWERSIENAPCKICRRRHDDQNMILCDECNGGYHIYCLRPPLKRIPIDDWFCLRCRPATRRKMPGLYVEIDSDQNEEHESIENTKRRDICEACQSGATEHDELISCSTCSCVFHMDCHRPPLRHEPRSGWRCCVCTKGVRFRGAKTRSGRSCR